MSTPSASWESCSVRVILEERNRHLLRDIQRLTEAIAQATFPRELQPYAQCIKRLCNGIRSHVNSNLQDLDLGGDAVIDDVLSSTHQEIRRFRVLSSHLVTPLLRASAADRLSLRVITWLHTQHPETSGYPAAVTDGDCSILPLRRLVPVYFFPAAERRILLYLPLYLHEFGHLLYACHKPEMDALVKGFQQIVEDTLTPLSYRGDRHASWQCSQREVIVTTWYKWIQEFFCDAIGLVMGGPAFVRTFSLYLGWLERGDFYRPCAELEDSTHPVTWLRVCILTSYASRLGLEPVVAPILAEWDTTAAALRVTRDYYGFYHDDLEGELLSTLEDMVVKAGARRFLPEEVNVGSTQVNRGESPVALFNKAWTVFRLGSEEEYSDWEQYAIDSWLGSWWKGGLSHLLTSFVRLLQRGSYLKPISRAH